jgi:peptide/nickel transport system substrate-binding protein
LGGRRWKKDVKVPDVAQINLVIQDTIQTFQEEEMSRKVNRRKFLTLAASGAAGLIVASCAPATTAPAAPAAPPPTAEVITQQVEVTRVVEVAGTPQVQVVTATPAPVQKAPPENVLGVVPRDQTLIADILTGRVGTPTNFNVWVGWKSQDRGIQNLAFEPLWTVDFATGKIINGSADGDPKYNTDFTTLDIPLRKGVTWADGEPFTSADVVYTVETLIAHKEFNAHSFFDANVKSVTAPDDNSVHFELKQSNSRFHTAFLDRWGCTWIMPKHIFEKQADPVQFEFNPCVGTGAYKQHSFDPQGYWTIWEKRDDWAKSPTGILFGEPQVKYVVYQNFANEGAKILAQLNHEADFISLSSNGLKAILAQSKTSRAYQPTFPWVVNNDPCITGICYNTAKAPYDKADVRWALTLAIDIVEYTGTAVDNTGTLSPVVVPHLGPYPKDYIEPMQDWLKAFTLDLGNGEKFQPYDPDAVTRLVAQAKANGYVFPTDAAYIEKTFGLGWYKYAPDAAEKLLIKNGFKRDKNKNWLKPDGTPWKIEFMTGTEQANHDYHNGMAAVQQWKKFGIDAEQFPTESAADLEAVGNYDVGGQWPAIEPWGAGPDLYRTLDPFNSAYVKPVGTRLTGGHTSRWSSANMDAVIAKLMATDPANEQAVIATGTDGLKEAVAQMPGTPTYGYIGFIAWDQYYWTNWPGSENPYTQPYCHWGTFKYMTPFLKPTGV